MSRSSGSFHLTKLSRYAILVYPVAKRPKKPTHPGPRLIPPAAAEPDEAIERIAPKRRITIEPDDVVIRRERVPSLNPKPLAAPPWRFRVRIGPTTTDGSVFNSFQHAASAAEQLAGGRRTRLLYLEDDVPALIADYRG